MEKTNYAPSSSLRVSEPEDATVEREWVLAAPVTPQCLGAVTRTSTRSTGGSSQDALSVIRQPLQMGLHSRVCSPEFLWSALAGSQCALKDYVLLPPSP